MEPALYPYYYCFTKRCESYGKANQREKIEGGFESLLHTLEPAAPLFKTAAKMFETWWNYRQTQIAQPGQAVEDEIRKLDGKIEQLMDRLVETDGDSMIKAYETRSCLNSHFRVDLNITEIQDLEPLKPHYLSRY